MSFQIQYLIVRMNNNILLQNYIENDRQLFGQEAQKLKKNAKMANYQVQLQIGTVFNEICQLVQDYNVKIDIPESITKISEKLDMIKSIVAHLLERNPQTTKPQLDQNGEAIKPACEDCQNYEASLQKLENDVRSHIRLEQQLKIYQDSMEEKIDQFKKQKKDFEKKNESQKRQIDELKAQLAFFNEKYVKTEHQTQKLKAELKQLKTGSDNLPSKRQHKPFGYQSKQNKIDWGHRQISIKKDDSIKKEQRKSIDKRQGSEQKWRMSVNPNNKSTKMFSIMNEKLVYEKNKEERKKAIQSKFQYRK